VGPLALYLADTGTVLVCRWRAGEPLGAPHRQHAYQRLTDTGLSHTAVAAVVLAVSSVVSALTLLTLEAGLLLRVAGDVAAGAVLLAYLASPNWRRDRVRP
jgi:UDP-N-acetylmuramyl pentapeptide phosphotransferase/UDP-N-acetylglucosamine-1-phosphate transferase